MALIPIYHLVPAKAAVDPSSNEISMGMCVALNGANGVRRVQGGDHGKVYGISGDNYTVSGTNYSLPGALPAHVGATGAHATWQNRVSDMWNETMASGMMTVYHSGGEFATDMFVNVNMDATKVGHYLKADEATGKLAYDNPTKTANSIAVLTRAAGAYPSGVPGTDINGDMALAGANTNQYIVFKLII